MMLVRSVPRLCQCHCCRLVSLCLVPCAPCLAHCVLSTSTDFDLDSDSDSDSDPPVPGLRPWILPLLRLQLTARPCRQCEPRLLDFPRRLSSVLSLRVLMMERKLADNPQSQIGGGKNSRTGIRTRIKTTTTTLMMTGATGTTGTIGTGMMMSMRTETGANGIGTETETANGIEKGIERGTGESVTASMTGTAVIETATGTGGTGTQTKRTIMITTMATITTGRGARGTGIRRWEGVMCR
jgi:hypothetical protein